MSAHTPTPWTDDKFTPIPAGDDRVLLGAFSQKPKVAVRVLSEENYQHAAKCVNEHDGLIEQIESLRAERDGLVEALRHVQFLSENDKINHFISRTFAKYEKK